MRGFYIAATLTILTLAGCGSSSTVTQTVIERAATESTPTPPTPAETTPTTAAAPSPSHTHTIPHLVGKRLDVAEEDANEAGIPFKVLGGGTFGVVVPSHWTVCEQEPSAGAKASRVKLIVARSC